MTVFTAAFQEQVLMLLVQDALSLDGVRPALDVTMFDGPIRKEIVRLLFQFYDKHEQAPSQSSMISMVDGLVIQNESAGVLYPEYVHLVEKMYSPLSDGDRAFLLENLESFIIDSRVQNCTMKLVSATSPAEYQEASQQLNEAVAFTLSNENNVLDWHTFDRTSYLNHPFSIPIPTGLKDLDNSINGGLRPGGLGIVVGPSGVGKSHLLIIFSMAAFMIGKRVLHVTLELSKEETMMRMDSFLTEQEGIHISTPAGNLVAQAKLHMLEEKGYGNLQILEHGMHTINVLQLEAEIKRRYAGKPFPELIVIDYGGLFLPIKSMKDNRYEEHGQSFSYLKGMARKFGVPIWTAFQANRAAKMAAVVDMEHTSESMKTVMISDVVITITRTRAHHLANLIMLYTAKVRGAESGREFYYRSQYQHSKLIPLDQQTFYDSLHYSQAIDANHQQGKKLKTMGVNDIGVLNTKIKSNLGI